MKRFLHYIPILVLISFLSCVAKPNASTIDNQNAMETLLVLKENSLEGFPEFSLVNSNDELGRIYSALNLTRMPGIVQPKLDFSKNTLVLMNSIVKSDKHFDIDFKTKIVDSKLEIKYFPSSNNKDLSAIPNSYRVIKVVKINKVNAISKIELLK